MRNLPVPIIDDKVKFTSIINGKSETIKNRLKRIRPTIKRRYDEYQYNIERLELISRSEITKTYADSLHHCYKTNTKEMSSLRDLLLEPDVDDFDKCPFCGLGEPTTLDHYLPKEDFPEFSVYAKNLIPVCGVCNSNYKGTKCFNNGERLFIHTYYDLFPEHDFITMNIDVTTSITINFSSVHVQGEDYFSSLFNNHFTNLGLSKRYKRKAVAEINRKKTALKRIYNRHNSAQEVSDELRNLAFSFREEYGGNSWKVALYDALASNMSFCNLGFEKGIKK